MTSREEIIQKFIKNKNILDIGCVSDKTESNYKFAGLHKFLLKNTKNVLGIDINEKGVNYLKKKGYNIIKGNAENFKLNKKFEVIVAGELIEHLSNPGLFLDTTNNHLKENGCLILTTPNAFGLRYYLRRILNILNVNKDHVLWHDEKTIMQLLKRHQFKVIKLKYTYDDYITINSKIERFLCFYKKLRPQLTVIAIKNN